MGQGTLLFRASLGDVLRAERVRQSMTLRELSSSARVSLGYISEIERGQKEASSELLGALCEALDVPLSSVLREVSDHVEAEEVALARVDGVPEVSRVVRVATLPAPEGSRDVVCSAA